MHKTGLHVDAQQHAEPHQVNAQLGGHRTQQRQDDEGDFEKVEKKCQEEDENIDGNQKADLSAGQPGEHVLHPACAVNALKNKREHPRANQDEHHHGGQAHGACHGVPDERAAQALVHGCQQQGTHHTHRTGFSRCGNGGVNARQAAHGAQHCKNQDGRWNDAAQAFEPQRTALQRAFCFRHARHMVGPHDADHEGVARKNQHLQDGRSPGAFVHVAHRAAQLVGHDDEHQRWRHQLRDRP